jgi:hypothetical protein
MAATPAAPASTQAAARPGVMPPIATTGRGDRAAIARSPVRPAADAPGFDAVGKTVPNKT